jgi:nucleotide-binding universal stress UspA family protein
MIKRILVPLDGSDTAELGLWQVIELALALKEPPHIILLNVIEAPMQIPEASFGYDAGSVASSLRQYGEAVLDKARARCEAAGLSAEVEVQDASGRVADTVVDRARARNCDLVVLGTHGRRGPSRWLMGSDAEIVVRHSSVPVLLVRNQRSGE